MGDEDDGGVEVEQVAPRATPARGCRGGWSARRAAAGRGAVASARASEARVSSPPEKVESGRSASSSAEAEARAGRRARRRASGSRRRLRAAAGRRRRRASSPRSALAATSPPRAAPARPRSRASRRGRRRRTRRARSPRFARRALVVQGDPGALAEGEAARVGRQLAGEHPQQGRLAGAVAAGERHPLARLELEGDVVEERLAADVDVSDVAVAIAIAGGPRCQ